MTKFELIHIEPDTHVPFHDERAWNLNLTVAEDRQPDHFIKLGDWMDVFTLSRHMKKPQFAGMTFKDELRKANELLDQQDHILRYTKNKVYIMGNHEARYDWYISTKAPELYGVTTIEKELKLKKRGWTVVPYKKKYELGKMTYTHDAGSHGGQAHLQAEQVHAASVIIGHTHRLGYAVVGNRKGKPHLAAMMGWLGSPTYADYIHDAISNRFWSHAIGTGIMDKNGVTYVTPHPFINYTVCVDGFVYGV